MGFGFGVNRLVISGTGLLPGVGRILAHPSLADVLMWKKLSDGLGAKRPKSKGDSCPFFQGCYFEYGPMS